MQQIGKTQVTKWQIGNSLMPAEGPRVISTLLDFAVQNDGFVFDSQNIVGDKESFSMVQSIFIDAQFTDDKVTVTVAKSGQVIIAKGRTQGWYPVCAPNTWFLQVTCTDANAKVPCILANYQVAPGYWPTT